MPLCIYFIFQCVSEEEEVTREEVKEEQDFIDAMVDTKVMEITMEFLSSKGLIGEDTMSFKRLLHRMWFALYPRSWRIKGSCAFEHVFLGEVKNGKVNGFHNWLFFLLEEQKGVKDSCIRIRIGTYDFFFEKKLVFENTPNLETVPSNQSVDV